MDTDSQVISRKYPILNNSQDDSLITIYLLLRTQVNAEHNDYNLLMYDKELENKVLLAFIKSKKKDNTNEDPQKVILSSKIQELYEDSEYNQIHNYILPSCQFWQNKLFKDAKNVYHTLEKKNDHLNIWFQKPDINNAQDITMTSKKESLEFWHTIIVSLINDKKIKNEYEYEINKEIQISMLIMDIRNFINISQISKVAISTITIDVLCHEKNEKIKNLIKNLSLDPNSEEDKIRIRNLIATFSKISSILSSEIFVRLFENQKNSLIVKQYLTTINNALNSKILLLKYLSNSLSDKQIDMIIDKMISPVIQEVFSQTLYIYDFLALEKLRDRNFILNNTSEYIENLLPIIMTRLFFYKNLCKKFKEFPSNITKNKNRKSRFTHLSDEEIIQYSNTITETAEINQNNSKKIISDFRESIGHKNYLIFFRNLYYDCIENFIEETQKHNSLCNNIMQNILGDHNRFLNLIDLPKAIKLIHNNYTANISIYDSYIQQRKPLERESAQSSGVNIEIIEPSYGFDIQKWSLLDPLSEIFEELGIDIKKLGKTSIAILENLIREDFSKKKLMESLSRLIVNSCHGIDDDGIKPITRYFYVKYHYKLSFTLSYKIIGMLSTTLIDETNLSPTHYSEKIKKNLSILSKNKISLDTKGNDCLIKIFFKNISLTPNQKSNFSFLGWIFLSFLIPYFKDRERIIHTILAISIVIITSKLTYQYLISIQNHNLSTHLANITENHMRIAQIENENNSSVKLH